MKILNLKLLNFRNYEKLSLDFDPKKNLIIGKNGKPILLKLSMFLHLQSPLEEQKKM